jgi:hypothetical protein
VPNWLRRARLDRFSRTAGGNESRCPVARDASDRGYRVIVLADCCESVTDEMHQFAITQILPAIGEVVTGRDFRHTLNPQP